MEQLERRVLEHAEPFNSDHIPPWVLLKESGISRDRLDFIIHPSKSFLVEIKATEIIATSAFATQWTLRFPRFVQVREDKNVNECMSVDGMFVASWSPLLFPKTSRGYRGSQSE